ncbi:hypothetical protein GH714_036558 [Hevea brasiliensis]|uniref:C2H2-type domain-containing protein n=1 Tax=Hevea brasiliensis TaxID=3981 RepID=A0A6A6LQU5_HEVBR|nr:hypothetical protein GH714_036558 [Hevea brasiliensis]
MESNLHEDSKSSCSEEETDRSEQANDDMGTGRSYECIFCKRGFTTAQALGGHMNIHRKDRAKPRPNSSVPSISGKVDDDYHVSFRGYPPIQSYSPHYSTAHHHHHELLNPFEEDWRRNLSLQIGPSHVDGNKGKTEDCSESDELDLELRLGHDP